jgi:hypothetical protein
MPCLSNNATTSDQIQGPQNPPGTNTMVAGRFVLFLFRLGHAIYRNALRRWLIETALVELGAQSVRGRDEGVRKVRPLLGLVLEQARGLEEAALLGECVA